MNKSWVNLWSGSAAKYVVYGIFTMLACVFQMPAQAVTVNVVGSDGAAVPYRWLVEEDGTKPVTPGKLADGTNLSLNFHTSYMPVIASGDSANSTDVTKLASLNRSKPYYISVMPGAGYQMGGAQVPACTAGASCPSSVTIVVNKLPIPTAQITVFAFNDNSPVNGMPDLPQEQGLADFTVTLTEAGGTYGQSGGAVTVDGFGRPLGTTYVQNADGSFAFDPDGRPTILQIGTGILKTSSDGTLRIKYLFPAKYTITMVPPAGSDWVQTSTIEGTKGIDAWVKPGEPAYFQEFGPPGHHVDIGFVRTINNTAVLNGGNTVTGRVVNMRSSRPPDFTFYNGEAVPQCRVGLSVNAVGGATLFTAPCNADSTFSIPNVPPGTYVLTVWDDPLDYLIATTNITVPANAGTVELLDVPVLSWFHKHTSRVFFDGNENGFRDAGEAPFPGQMINLRFRDGSIYQSAPTVKNLEETLAEAKFKEVFPFFNWLIVEVDFAKFKATGATVIVDDGGPILPHNGWSMPTFDILNPQPQSENGNLPYRTETGVILLEGMQAFTGNASIIEWGKKTYAAGENGGIAGIVHYATTRAEDDPRYAAAENWEPGIPRVQVNLYRDCNGDGIIDSADCTQLGVPLGVDGFHAKLATQNCNFAAGACGDAYDVTTADSWDDKQPTGCQGEKFISNGVNTDCYDGQRNFNQIRPAVFDGGYAFGTVAGKDTLPAGKYIVEAIAPPGYKHQGNGDKNVVFGDSVTPSPLALPPLCVGDPAPVPEFLTLFADPPTTNPSYTKGLRTWNQCDRKQVEVKQGLNAAADFFMFTEVPVSGHIAGIILDNASNQYDPNAPSFGEKYSPPWIPVSVRDWTGREISRVYSDQWGAFNALVPSTFTINPPFPSGVSPNMITTCINSPGPIKDERTGSPTLGQMIIDPYFQRQYSQFCYTFQYLPGKTTYLDTPVTPVAAFAGPNQFPVDCEFPEFTPVIYSVTGRGQNGPYVPTPTAGTALPVLEIVSAGKVEVTNPAYDGTGNTSKTVLRDFGFGTVQGTVKLNGLTLPVLSWTDGVVTVSVPVGASTGQLELTRATTGVVPNVVQGKSTITGVTVTVGGTAPRVVSPGGNIQAAIDAANKGDLILVPPGTYSELVIMNKQVRLQGWGALSTVINAAKTDTNMLQRWRGKVATLTSTFDLVPGQTAGAFNAPNNEPSLFNTEEGPGILVVAKATGTAAFTNVNPARIDGITITGADHGGAIFVNGYANYLEISNNKLLSNYGTYHGGIRLGHPGIIDPNPVNAAVSGGFSSNNNSNVNIHHNHIAQNAGADGAGGGISLCAGSENYRITRNYICGNYSQGNGGGIGHIGLSNNGKIEGNTILFNQVFNQGRPAAGGGIYVGGQPGITVGTLSPGAGAGLVIDSNLIQGNNAGAGDGGGIFTQFVNGLDVSRSTNPTRWYGLTVFNNMIVNNVAGLAGGGMGLQDTAKANVSNNTFSNNDNTSTARAAFATGNLNTSQPQPGAGLVSRAHTPALNTAMGSGNAQYKTFSNPQLYNNILWHNRSFYWAIDNSVSPAVNMLFPDVGNGAPPVYSDLAVLGVAGALSPHNGIMTSIAGYAADNIANDPQFVSWYLNGSRNQVVAAPEIATNFGTAAAFDEGGNFIDVRYGPLQPIGNYHIGATSPAINLGAFASAALVLPTLDIDGQVRTARPDAGADEFGTATALPAVSISPTSLTFGNQVLGTTSAAQTVTVTNTGGGPLIFNTIGISGNFAIVPGTTTCRTGAANAVPANGGFCVINVTFSPTGLFPGARTGTLTLADNAPGTPQTVPLRGTAVTALTVTPSPLSFGTVARGTTSGQRVLTVTNNNPAAAVTLAAANALQFTLNSPFGLGVQYVITPVPGANNCTNFSSAGVNLNTGTTIPAGGTCVIGVQFKPTLAGSTNDTRTSVLTITNYALSGGFAVLTGVAQ
ncbi:MAG: choice-of-anchor D domain-containing protein [Burkholderiales bacterium]